MDKVPINLFHAKGKKRDKKLIINSFMIVIGDSLKIDYLIEEEN